MTHPDERFARAIARFDAANAEDPNRTLVDGVDHPHELYYARRMTHWLDRLRPDAPEPLRLAVRSQHLCRWQFPRSEYPQGVKGYRDWRTAAASFHARNAGEILRDVGYDDATVRRVQSLLRKEGIKKDPDIQTLEDVACLVFLETEFTDFAAKHDAEKVHHIMMRTLGKMSPVGHRWAMGAEEVPPAAKALIEELTMAKLPIVLPPEGLQRRPTSRS